MVTLPERDRNGKLGSRSADACHLGYDPRRGSHFAYVPNLQRLSSFIATEWREDSFTICKTISADTPVEYFESADLPIAPVTAAMIPAPVSSLQLPVLSVDLRIRSTRLVCRRKWSCKW